MMLRAADATANDVRVSSPKVSILFRNFRHHRNGEVTGQPLVSKVLRSRAKRATPSGASAEMGHDTMPKIFRVLAITDLAVVGVEGTGSCGAGLAKYLVRAEAGVARHILRRR